MIALGVEWVRSMIHPNDSSSCWMGSQYNTPDDWFSLLVQRQEKSPISETDIVPPIWCCWQRQKHFNDRRFVLFVGDHAVVCYIVAVDENVAPISLHSHKKFQRNFCKRVLLETKRKRLAVYTCLTENDDFFRPPRWHQNHEYENEPCGRPYSRL